MAVLLYQIGIFLAIQIAAFFGKKSRNTAVILISIFTVLQVFMSWLLLLQFVTILIAYSISNNFITKEKPKRENKENNVLYSFRVENGGRGVREVDLNDPYLDEKTRERAKLQEDIRKESERSYENDPDYRKALDDVLNNFGNRGK